MSNYNFDYDWYYLNRANNYLDKSKNNLFDPKEGFEKGNMFTNLYSEYKNYNPKKLIARSEEEEKLFDLQAICFVAHELNLYLDLHPDDQSMLMLLKDYLKKEEQLIKEYELKYGPMTISNIVDSNYFNWIKNWPWEVKNV